MTHPPHTRPLAGAPAAAGDPAVGVFSPHPAMVNGQQHIAYGSGSGTVWDCWYDPAVQGPQAWRAQRINGVTADPGPGPLTGAPAAMYGPSVWEVSYQQQHFTFTDADGAIWDCFYDGPADAWREQQLNLGRAGAVAETAQIRHR